MFKFVKYIFMVSLIGLSLTMVSVKYAEASPQLQCRGNLNELQRAMIVMLNKIPLMPPIAKVYQPIRDLESEAAQSEKEGDYDACVSQTELALQYARPYAR